MKLYSVKLHSLSFLQMPRSQYSTLIENISKKIIMRTYYMQECGEAGQDLKDFKRF